METEPHPLVFLFSVSLTGLAPVDNGVNANVASRRVAVGGPSGHGRPAS